MPIKFEKILQSNLPKSVAPGMDVVYFTDKGEIHVSKTDGTLLQLGGKDIDLSPYFTKLEAGDLELLQTTEKSNLVAAINEVLGLVGTGGEIPEVDLSDYYTKEEANTLLDGKARVEHTHSEYTTEEKVKQLIQENAPTGGTVDLSNYYNKEEVDNLLNGKSPIGHTHDEYQTSTQVGAAIANYAYSKAEVDALVASSGGSTGTTTESRTFSGEIIEIDNSVAGNTESIVIYGATEIVDGGESSVGEGVSGVTAFASDGFVAPNGHTYTNYCTFSYDGNVYTVFANGDIYLDTDNSLVRWGNGASALYNGSLDNLGTLIRTDSYAGSFTYTLFVSSNLDIGENIPPTIAPAKYKITLVSTNKENSVQDTLEIVLEEPLRGLEDGSVRDRIYQDTEGVKIERNVSNELTALSQPATTLLEGVESLQLATYSGYTKITTTQDSKKALLQVAAKVTASSPPDTGGGSCDLAPVIARLDDIEVQLSSIQDQLTYLNNTMRFDAYILAETPKTYTSVASTTVVGGGFVPAVDLFVDKIRVLLPKGSIQSIKVYTASASSASDTGLDKEAITTILRANVGIMEPSDTWVELELYTNVAAGTLLWIDIEGTSLIPYYATPTTSPSRLTITGYNWTGAKLYIDSDTYPIQLVGTVRGN